MRVPGDQAVVDLSKVEKKVLEQIKQRLTNHEMRNQAQKLTREERREKKRRKMHEDTSTQVHVCLFRVADLSEPRLRFKVDVNAQQNHLTGGVLVCKDPAARGCNLVVVEGGVKAVTRFKKLMTQRIRWAGDDRRADDAAERGGAAGASARRRRRRGGRRRRGRRRRDDFAAGPAGRPGRRRQPVRPAWEGVLAKRTFGKFSIQECRTASTARKVMESKGVVHYWDMVLKAPRVSA